MSKEIRRLKRNYRKFHKQLGEGEIVPFREYAKLYPDGAGWAARKRGRR